jgi:hypothetical protein
VDLGGEDVRWRGGYVSFTFRDGDGIGCVIFGGDSFVVARVSVCGGWEYHGGDDSAVWLRTNS